MGETRGKGDPATCFFDSEPFLAVVADVYFPGKQTRVVDADADGLRVRLLEVEGRLVDRVPFLDFHESLGEATPEAGLPRAGYLERVVREVVPAETWLAEDHPPGFGAAPFVDWSRFVTWGDYRRFMRDHGSSTLKEGRRRRRRLEKIWGPVAFFFHHPAPELLELLMQWKSAQCRATGLPDPFMRPQNVELLRRLHRRGLLTMSVLRVGVQPAAITMGVVWDDRYHGWVSAYDPQLASGSPGTVLLQSVLEESHRLGHRTFELLVGDEAYKWRYASDVRVVGPVGEPPLPTRLWRPVRASLTSVLRVSPSAYALAQRTRRYLVEHGVL